MTTDDARKQLDELRRILKLASKKLRQQDEKLRELTAAPYMYATVVAVNMIEERPFSNRKRTFTGIGGQTVTVNEQVKKDGLHVGDILRVRDGVELDEPIMEATKLEIVGFLDNDQVVTQVDGKKVYADIDFRDYYEVTRPAKDTVVLSVNGTFVEVYHPGDCEVKPGDTVCVVKETMQIIDVAKVQIAGSIGYLRRLIDDVFAEVDHEGAVRVVFRGPTGTKLEVGDRIILDSSGAVIVKNLGKEEQRFTVDTGMRVTWDEIGGLEDAKREMQEAVELPHKNPKLFKFYGKRPIKGVLLYGPPGCGKTLLGKACATALADIYKGATSTHGFIYIKGPEILDRYVGSAEATVRHIFERARKHKSEHGYPAVLFIDEADAILAKRGSGISSDVERTIVPMFLTEMDGIEETGALVVLATNRSDILDPAIVRDGRVDRKIKITRPTPESAIVIAEMHLRKIPLHNGYTHKDIAAALTDELFSAKRVLYNIHTKRNGIIPFTLGHTINGAMVVGVVDQATSIALQRDLHKKKPEGLTQGDVIAAVDAVERQNRDINHADAIAEFAQDFGKDILSIERYVQSNG